jgi:hypothetical protein
MFHLSRCRNQSIIHPQWTIFVSPHQIRCSSGNRRIHMDHAQTLEQTPDLPSFPIGQATLGK